MPWKIVAGSSECPSDKPFAVVKEADGSVAGCHDSEESAQDQLAALYASEKMNLDDALDDDALDDNQHSDDNADTDVIDDLDDNLDDNLDDDEEKRRKKAQALMNTNVTSSDERAEFEFEILPDEDGMYSTIITVEGRETGDGRMFAEGSLEWGELPLPLMWQQSTSTGHDGSVLVGQITDLKRTGEFIRGKGYFDLGGAESSHAHEAHRLVKSKMLRGVSVDVDNVKDSDIEFIYDDSAQMDNEIDSLFASPSLVKFNKGRIRGATLTPFPAFVEAKVELGSGLFDVDEEGPGVPAHTTEFDLLSSWNTDEMNSQVPTKIGLGTALDAYAMVNRHAVVNGVVEKRECAFLHHQIDRFGRVGPANITACAANIHRLNTSRTYIELPDVVRKKVYDHLAAHILEAGLIPGAFETKQAVTAAMTVITLNDLPPAAWFNEPRDVKMHGALTVTDEGRVFGLIAPANVNHRSFPGQSVKAPSRNVDYSRFINGETIVAEGGRIPTGVITMECGHASTYSNADATMEHYDNSCSVVARVRVGENEHGTWVAGALAPWASSEQIVKMMACQLSGDWRPHSNEKGKYEFCAALLVPVPGFPMARTQASVSVREGAIVASSVPVKFVKTDDVDAEMPVDAVTPAVVKNDGIRAAAQMIATGLGRDRQSRINELREMVYGK